MSTYTKILQSKPVSLTVLFSTSLLSILPLASVHAVLPALQEIQASDTNQDNQPSYYQNNYQVNNLVNEQTTTLADDQSSQKDLQPSYLQKSQNNVEPGDEPTYEPNNLDINPSNDVAIDQNIADQDTTVQVIEDKMIDPLAAAIPNLTINKELSIAVIKVNELGEQVFVPLSADIKVVAGDVIVYQATVSNNSEHRVKSMHIDLNIPNSVAFLGFDQMTPKATFASADGFNFYHAPIMASVNGIRQELPLSNYKALRWNIEMLAVDESVTIQYRGIVK